MSKIISVYKSSAPPFPTAVMANAYVMSMKDSIGLDDHYLVLFDIITEKNNDWHFVDEDIERLTPKVVDALVSDPAIVDRCRDKYLHHISKVNELLKRGTLYDRLASMSEGYLADLLAEAATEYRLAAYYVEPPNFSLEVGGHDIVKQRFQKYFKDQDIQLVRSDFENYFASLISFTEISFIQAVELSILRIALLGGDERARAIAEHEKNYYWILYDYYGPILDQETIKEELKPLLTLSKKEIKNRIDKIHSSVRENEEDLQKNLVKYSLPDELKKAAQAIRDFAYLYSDIKKQHTSRANVGFGEIIKFLAKKYKIDAFLLHYATYEELLSLAKGENEINLDTVRKRIQSSILTCQEPDQYYAFLNGKEAKRVLKKKGNLAEESVTNLKGMPANSGKYTGPARIIINASQINRVQKGDVLVAPMTTVGYVPAMKKAGAIITDIGGITSHAAIVSRELGVPCIVGLKVATTAFKDGDMLEVNANHGTVKKINSVGD